MNLKQVMVMVIIMATFFTVAIGGFIAIYQFKPELIGFAPKRSAGDSLNAANKAKFASKAATEETIAISQDKLKSMESALSENLRLLGVKDSLYKNNRSLADSVNRVIKKISDLNRTINSYKDSVSKSKKSQTDKDKFALSLQDSIARLRYESKNFDERLKLANKRIEDGDKFISKKQDSLERKNFAMFAKIYDQANPREVAKILEQIEERDAAKILKLMQKKKAGKVLDAMKSETAAAILLLGAGE